MFVHKWVLKRLGGRVLGLLDVDRRPTFPLRNRRSFVKCHTYWKRSWRRFLSVWLTLATDDPGNNEFTLNVCFLHTTLHFTQASKTYSVQLVHLLTPSVKFALSLHTIAQKAIRVSVYTTKKLLTRLWSNIIFVSWPQAQAYGR